MEKLICEKLKNKLQEFYMHKKNIYCNGKRKKKLITQQFKEFDVYHILELFGVARSMRFIKYSRIACKNR